MLLQSEKGVVALVVMDLGMVVEMARVELVRFCCLRCNHWMEPLMDNHFLDSMWPVSDRSRHTETR